MPRFETIGNATLIIYEGIKNKNPLLATDVWLDEDDAYFGSWRLSHEIPLEQKEALKKVKYIFISHFHPDHLNLKSLNKCKQATFILAQHYGSRVEKDLRQAGFTVINLPSRKWINIGKKTRIILFNNEIQDSSILIEIEDDTGQKTLLLNLNDSGGRGNIKEIGRISSKYKNSFYLQLHSYGDADMINFFDEHGSRIEPNPCINKIQIGTQYSTAMSKLNCNVAIPFSCHHQYQRRDSFWANDYITPLSSHYDGFNNNDKTLLQPFQNIILVDGGYKAFNINPDPINITHPIPESEFKDNWSDKLTDKEVSICKDYFCSIQTLKRNYKNISLIVGNDKTTIFDNGNGNTFLTFEVPKNSLMQAIRNEIFDDLLIGNFMKTTLKNGLNLYNPDFTFATAKYSDNGGVKTSEELREYFAYYNSNRSNIDKIALKKEKIQKVIKRLLDFNVFKIISKTFSKQ